MDLETMPSGPCQVSYQAGAGAHLDHPKVFFSDIVEMDGPNTLDRDRLPASPGPLQIIYMWKKINNNKLER